MKRLSIVALGILLASGCSSSNSTSPSTTSGPTTTRFTADLKASNESPAISNAEASGGGTATIDMTSDERLSGKRDVHGIQLQRHHAGFPVDKRREHRTHPYGATGVNGADPRNTTTINPGEVVLNGGAGNFNENGNHECDLTNADAQAI